MKTDKLPANLIHAYDAYFNNLKDGEVALSFHEWLEAIS